MFVTYFPHLIAGPILHHKDMIPQFEREQTKRPDYHLILCGLIIFAIGLFKKTCLADGIQPFNLFGCEHFRSVYQFAGSNYQLVG